MVEGRDWIVTVWRAGGGERDNAKGKAERQIGRKRKGWICIFEV